MKKVFLKTRFFNTHEKKKLQNFISINYKKDHVIVKSSKIINFFFLNKLKNKINFIGSFLNNKLVSIIGILNNRHWDKSLKSDMQLSLWINKKKNSVSGLETIKFILNELKPYSLLTSGLNLQTSGKIFSMIGKVKKYDHFYICNPKLKKNVSKNLNFFNIKFSNKEKKLSIEKSYKLISIPKYSYFPKKSEMFFLNKYTRNPFYNYFYLNFKSQNKIYFFFICREIYIKKLKKKILRIVDFYGNFPKNMNFKNIITSFLIENNYEYIDFVIYGINHKKLKDIGFEIKNNNQIIPNYFEPFVKKNIDLNLAIIVNPYGDKLVSVKGDSDQERPNKI